MACWECNTHEYLCAEYDRAGACTCACHDDACHVVGCYAVAIRGTEPPICPAHSQAHNHSA
jgi:hypothetical protein